MPNTHSIDLELSSSQCLYTADSAALSIVGDLTLEAWIKLESAPSATAKQIMSKWANGSTWQRASYRFWVGDNTLNLGLSSGADGSNSSVAWSPSTGVWYHVACVYDASAGTVDFYVDGVQQGTQQSGAMTSIYNNDQEFYIGCDQGWPSDQPQQFFDGLIDEVRVWDVIRTEQEINDNKAVQIDSATNLKGSWHLDNALTDSSGNGQTLTNVNSSAFSTDIPFGAVSGPAKLKTANTLAANKIKTKNTLAIAKIKTINTLP